jgi:hypothetical protein
MATTLSWADTFTGLLSEEMGMDYKYIQQDEAGKHNKKPFGISQWKIKLGF